MKFIVLFVAVLAVYAVVGTDSLHIELGSVDANAPNAPVLEDVFAATKPKLNKSDVIFTPQIVGGVSVIEDLPHQISLQYYGGHICGASIISPLRILTAAHCTDGRSASALSIRAGSRNHASGGQVIQVSRIIQNPQYNPSTEDGDVSILELRSPLVLNERVQPIP